MGIRVSFPSEPVLVGLMKSILQTWDCGKMDCPLRSPPGTPRWQTGHLFFTWWMMFK